MKKDLEQKKDTEMLVNAFYGRVKQDPLLSPLFNERIPEEAWPQHLQRMYAFWNAILFAEKGFEGNPMLKHLSLPVEGRHFDQWLSLFMQTVDELFAGPKADKAKMRASSIAHLMQFKIASLRTNPLAG
jgi:hemoglobin